MTVTHPSINEPPRKERRVLGPGWTSLPPSQLGISSLVNRAGMIKGTISTCLS